MTERHENLPLFRGSKGGERAPGAKLKAPTTRMVAQVQATFGKAREELLEELSRQGYEVLALAGLPLKVRLIQKAFPRDWDWQWGGSAGAAPRRAGGRASRFPGTGPPTLETA